MPGRGVYDKAKVLGRTGIISLPDSKGVQHVLYTGGRLTEAPVAAVNDWFIGDFCLVTCPVLYLGEGAQVNAGAKLLGRDHIRIGHRSVIGYDALLMTSSDTPNPPEWKHNDFSPEEERRVKSAPIVIGDDCFVGSKAILMPGTTLPDNAVVPAGAYVTVDKDGKTAIQHWKSGRQTL